LWRAAGGDIRQIICTHSHPDHSPGAKPLQTLCAHAANGVPPILGLPSAATAAANSQFAPDKTLLNQELLALVPIGLEPNLTHHLKVIYTPGHAANHLCLVLVEDGLLFSGDHVLNGSTTVVNPPDGEMTAYLDSLDLLSAACKDHHINFILPAHGYVLGNAPQAISHLKAHRLKREAKILKVMQAQPDGSMDDWVAKAYDDVPERMWPVAKRSLLAHVERIQALG
jgi:recombination protein RecT